MLTGISTIVAIVLSVPAGVLASRVAAVRGPLLGAIGILQTIPSLAMLAILLALLGRIGVLPAVIALTLYALLPIARNTLAGLDGVSPEVKEAARGIGMTPLQQLFLAELPLALPVIVAGIRTAAVVAVGIATLSAFIGAGGLGQFINRGLALSDTRLILLGAVPAALLAVLVDGSLAAAGWAMRPTRQADRERFAARLKPILCAQPLFLVAAGVFAFFGAGSDPSASESGRIRIGSKNFTEQILLGELMAIMVEENTFFEVDRRFNLGGTMICHGALARGEIDVYAEYTGTGVTAVLKRDAADVPGDALRFLRKEYRERFGLTWLVPFGFDNTYTITVRREDSDRNGWQTISDLLPAAPSLRAGITAEFAERPDGYPGLRAAYGFGFGSVVDLDPALLYDAIAEGQVDVICAFATDGRLRAYDLVCLEDDRQFFPAYRAAPVIRQGVHPAVRDVLNLLGGAIDGAEMQRLNDAVDGEGRAPRTVARAFLESKQLVEKGED